jgi:tRNA (mo5U34)-methyltransferase
MNRHHPDEEQLLGREWLYPFRLPSGRVTPTVQNGRFDIVHATRLRMMDDALGQAIGDDYSGLTAIDLACNQGYFGFELVRRGCRRVLGVDARQHFVHEANLLARVLAYEQYEAFHHDVQTLVPAVLGEFDIVLMLGLLYHLENPVGALRIARALTRRVCIVETQIVPQVSGAVDWGSYQNIKVMKGCFGIIDETQDVDFPLASMTGICLAPSIDGLVWVMRTVGFDQVQVIPVPADGYEQHVAGKRVMVVGLCDAPG